MGVHLFTQSFAVHAPQGRQHTVPEGFPVGISISIHAPPQRFRCLLSHFIIKPQLNKLDNQSNQVVSYLISSSNHNTWAVMLNKPSVVSYLISSSNHNTEHTVDSDFSVVSYLISSSNHNQNVVRIFVRFVVSYLISSSNHNLVFPRYTRIRLCLISFHHQTTTSRCYGW